MKSKPIEVCPKLETRHQISAGRSPAAGPDVGEAGVKPRPGPAQASPRPRLLILKLAWPSAQIISGEQRSEPSVQAACGRFFQSSTCVELNSGQDGTLGK